MFQDVPGELEASVKRLPAVPVSVSVPVTVWVLPAAKVNVSGVFVE